jgi:flagellar hook-associated protein 1 FlgK
MPNIFRTAISGLNVAQALLATTSHNVTNVETEGYSRQITSMTTEKPNLLGNNYIGSGVRLGVTKRIVDNALISNSRENLSTLKYWETQEKYTKDLNVMLGDPETNTNTAFDGFFSAINQLSTQAPDVDQSNILLQQVMTKTQNLVDNINDKARQLNVMHENLSMDMSVAITELNNILAELANLNLQISLAQAQAQGGEPNDLKDRRDLCLRNLAKIADIEIIEMKDATVNVTLVNGQGLVTGATYDTYSTQRDLNNPKNAQVIKITSRGEKLIMDDFFKGGQVGAMLDFQNNTLLGVTGDLNKLVVNFALTCNEQHKLGMDSTGAIGRNLFTDFNQISYQLARSMSDTGNIGNATFQVSINNIPRPVSAPYSTTSAATALVTTGTLTAIGASQLSLNGFNIAVPTAADDTLSPVADRAASAIALAKVINTTVGQRNISATANINVVNLGTLVTTGTMAAAGNFVVNGTNIRSTGTSSQVVVDDINSQSYLTGVRSELDASNNILLIADDGRNIQVAANGTATGSFQYFDTTVASSQVARASVTITSDPFPLTIAGSSPASAGLTAMNLPAITTSLTSSDYTLSFDGNYYSLYRQSDKSVVAHSASSTIAIDGFTLQLTSGAMVANDSFTIRPTIDAADTLSLNIIDIKKLALASPLRVANDITNTGTAKIKLAALLTTSGPSGTATTYGNAFTNTKVLTPPIQLKFFNDAAGQPTLYKILDMTNGTPGVQIGPQRQYNANGINQIFPLPGVQDGNNAPYTWDPGYRISLSGAVGTGDTFNVTINDGKSNFSNATEFTTMQQEVILDNSTISYQAFYAKLISGVGINTNQATSRAKDATSLLKISDDRLAAFSGVNMDEECANLIRYQQQYSAAAQLITAQKSIFDTLLMALR